MSENPPLPNFEQNQSVFSQASVEINSLNIRIQNFKTSLKHQEFQKNEREKLFALKRNMIETAQAMEGHF